MMTISGYGLRRAVVKFFLVRLAQFVGFIMLVDAFGLMVWMASEQVPPDSFYIGTITAHILGLFM